MMVMVMVMVMVVSQAGGSPIEPEECNLLPSQRGGILPASEHTSSFQRLAQVDRQRWDGTRQESSQWCFEPQNAGGRSQLHECVQVCIYVYVCMYICMYM